MGRTLGSAANLAPRCPAAAGLVSNHSAISCRSLATAGSMTRGRRGAAAAAATPEDVSAVLQRYEELPKAVVFDADYTLWPFWCEMFSPSDTPWLYPDILPILDGLHQAGMKLALASRTPTPHVANAFLDKLGLRQRFHSIQLIPAANGYDQHSAQKDKAHFPAIQRELAIDYRDMVDTDTGVDLAALKQGLEAYTKARQSAA